MSILKPVFSLALRTTTSVGPSIGILHHSKGIPLYSASVLQSRWLSSHDVTKNIQFITNDNNFKLEKDPETFKLVKPMEKPLCILFTWMLAKHKHVKKFAQLYTDQGFDVLSVSCTPWQLLWPVKGSQLVAADFLKFMDANPSPGPMVLHGFSVGGYMCGEVGLLVDKNKAKYQPILDRIAAQIWDSAADISEIPIGVPKAIFPKNKVAQNTLRKYILYHMKTFHESATIHYMRASEEFHLRPCKAPALFFFSKSDPVGNVENNLKVCESWKRMGMQVTYKCWDKSPHVMHFIHHKAEYLEYLSNHLQAQGLLTQPEKIRAALQ